MKALKFNIELKIRGKAKSQYSREIIHKRLRELSYRSDGESLREIKYLNHLLVKLDARPS